MARVKGKKCSTIEELGEYILDVMENGNEELEVNDAGSFLDWLHNYLQDIVYDY